MGTNGVNAGIVDAVQAPPNARAVTKRPKAAAAITQIYAQQGA
jgi:hypothetical protein